jgi:hypothetical protein
MTASNMTIWDAVSKTDPAHTKAFSRAGGFKGTAIKPIWTVKRLTEQFGPVGKGWGMGEPIFNVVPADGELMVYCTVTCWHTDSSQTFVGVGGDKVTAKRSSGTFNDDEAFKKAFTDAVGNAFKFCGFGADVHMGQFEDSKYVQETAREFAANDTDKPKRAEKWEGPYSGKSALHKGLVEVDRNIRGCGDLAELEAYLATDEYQAFQTSCQRYSPHYLTGGDPAPAEFVGIYDLIKSMRAEYELREAEGDNDVRHAMEGKA